MDERTLTAWLITQGFLQPDQVKDVLGEQLRRSQRGEKLDVIDVARAKGLLTDEQVLEVLERTGYTPQRGPVSVAAAASQEVSAVREPLPSAAAPPQQASDESRVAPVDAAGVAEPARATAPPRRRSSGSRMAISGTYAAHRKRSSSGPFVALGAAFCLLVLLFLFASGSPPPATSQGDGGEGGPEVAPLRPPPGQAEIAELVRQVDRLADRPVVNEAARRREIASLRQAIARLRAENGRTVSQLQTLDRADARLRGFEEALGGSVGEGAEQKADPLLEAQAEQAWRRTTRNFEKILWLALQQERSPLQRGAEAVRGVDQREDLAKRIRHYAAKGPEGIASLVASEDLHPIIGVGGYEALLAEVDRFPDDLRASKVWRRWEVIAGQFEKLRDRARAYARALRRAEEASARGDLAAARRAFLEGPYAVSDRWWAAVREFLDLPEVQRAFAARAKALEAGEGPAWGSDPITAVSPKSKARTLIAGGSWKERFFALSAEHKRAGKDEERRRAAVEGLTALLEETLRLARTSFATCQEVVETFDEHPRVFRKEAALAPPLKAHHQLYFEGAFARASGPETFRALDRWCDRHGYEAWRAKLRPYLRLVAAAASKKGRAREKRRAGRAAAREAVAAFAKKRVQDAAEGFGDVIEWMRKRRYAPAAAKDELGGMIARGVERAGDPVRGARLRAELEELEDDPAAENRSSHEKGFRKQVDLLVKGIVSRSLEAVTKCVNAGEPGLAFDLFQYVLLLDPDNDRAHKGLGHVKVDGKWMRRFLAERLRAGYAWSSQFAWVKRGEEERYARGEVYDLTDQTWRSLKEADARHADASTPWVVTTEHFELRSTAPLETTARVAERLEAFYLAMFRQYDLFFASKGGAKLIFGMAPSQSKPLVVNFYRDRAQFQRVANPPTQWAAGFYSGGRHASFFYASRDWTTLQHEIVHQILGESSPGGAESWLAEGAAVYLEDAFFRDGVLTLGSKQNHSRVVAYENAQRSGGQEHRLKTMLTFRTMAEWDSGDIAKNYRGAGAVVYFLCHFDGGRYRSDFVEFLRDAYYGRRPRLEDYFGLPVDVLDALMQRFYVPGSKLALPGGGELASGEELEAAKQAFTASCGKSKPDLDQITEAYALLRRALRGASGKEADKARRAAGRALASLRKKQATRVERAIKGAVDKKGLQARMAKLQELRAAALAVIEDPSVYPDANHGAAGQPLVDEKVKALAEFWNELPPVLEEPEVKASLELIEATEPWLDELEVTGKKRGKSAEDLREELRKRAGLANVVLTADDQRREERERKVREWNASQTQVPETTRAQVRVLNDYREMLGRHLLAIEQRLFQAAQKHSEWMNQSGNMSHTQPNPATRTPADRARREGYEAGVAENVAFGYHTPEAVHRGWYTSSGHHRNMISKNVYEIGVGKSGTYWCQLFGMRKPPQID